MLSVLCVQSNSNYYKIPGLDLWDEKRDAYNFTGSNPVIAHPPCAQWSRMKHFANDHKKEKELAIFCYEKVKLNGGILEHPAGSSLFKFLNIPRKQTFSINQHWFSFPAQKRTYLYVNQIDLLPVPLNFSAVQKKVTDLDKKLRSQMTIEFC